MKFNEVGGKKQVVDLWISFWGTVQNGKGWREFCWDQLKKSHFYLGNSLEISYVNFN